MNHLTELLLVEVETIVSTLPEGVTLRAWFEEGCPFEILGFGDLTQHEDTCRAYGYLHGVADALDTPILDLLDEHKILDEKECETTRALVDAESGRRVELARKVTP